MTNASGAFGAALRARRARLGLTQRELARLAGVSERVVRYVERGTAPGPASLHRLASAVGLDPRGFGGAGHPFARIGVLGPLVVSGAEPVPPARRRLLGLLALHPNRVVRLAEITAALWDGLPPPSHARLVHDHVAGLRGLRPVEPVDGGYRLVVDAEGLDLLRFDELVATGGAGALAEAAALWRGPVLADLPPALREHPTAVALRRRRIAAVLAHADLVPPAPAEPVPPPLAALARDEPLHEGVQARLVLALARAGQRIPALRLYERVRARLGAQPGRALREARRAALGGQA